MFNVGPTSYLHQCLMLYSNTDTNIASQTISRGVIKWKNQRSYFCYTTGILHHVLLALPRLWDNEDQFLKSLPTNNLWRKYDTNFVIHESNKHYIPAYVDQGMLPRLRVIQYNCRQYNANALGYYYSQPVKQVMDAEDLQYGGRDL